MKDVFYLAWKHLAYHRIKTVVLVVSITMIVYLPLGLNTLVTQGAKELRVRANATPLLVGAKGSPLELVLSSLYFESDIPPSMRYAEVKRIEQTRLALAIPLYPRFRTRQSMIVGTSLEYFDFRGLKIKSGRTFGMLGECVLGAQAARMSGSQPSDTVSSAPESVFDIAGIYPLKMKVVGVLQPTGTPDDRAVFVDIRTAWVIEGLAHGHDELSRSGGDSAVLRRDGNTIIANASVVQYNEITPENVASFHFHGDSVEFPVTATIVVPQNEKSATLLQGRYLSDDELVQIIRPNDIMDELLRMVLTVQRYMMLAVALAGIATLATMILVFCLSLQLRQREMETIVKIGGSRARIASLIAAEIVGVIVAGVAMAGLGSLGTRWLVVYTTRLFILIT